MILQSETCFVGDISAYTVLIPECQKIMYLNDQIPLTLLQHVQSLKNMVKSGIYLVLLTLQMS